MKIYNFIWHMFCKIDENVNRFLKHYIVSSEILFNFKTFFFIYIYEIKIALRSYISVH